jgi:glycosyltransferase involved in cell wall biosynthesis
VLSQIPAPLEVIVSDDGSEDNLESALSPFRGRVRLVRGPNQGEAVARNRAAAIANGELLGLLDADDIWLPGRLAALTRAASDRPDLSIFTTDALFVRDGVADALTYYDLRHFPIERQDLAILGTNFIFGAGAVRRQAFDEVGGYDPAARSAADWSLWLRLLLSGHQAGLVRAPLYEYRRGAASITGNKVNLAVAVSGVLDRTWPRISRGDQADVLSQTEREWRSKAVRYAHRTGDRRIRQLALSALRSGGYELPQHARLLAHFLLPRFR